MFEKPVGQFRPIATQAKQSENRNLHKVVAPFAFPVCKSSDAESQINDVSIERSFKSIKILFEILIQKLKPTITEKNDFGWRNVKNTSSIFRTIKIKMQRKKSIVFKLNTPLYHSFWLKSWWKNWSQNIRRSMSWNIYKLPKSPGAFSVISSNQTTANKINKIKVSVKPFFVVAIEKNCFEKQNNSKTRTFICISQLLRSPQKEGNRGFSNPTTSYIEVVLYWDTVARYPVCR